MYNTQEVSKLDSKSRKCVFLGYADGVKGYHLWDPTANKVVINWCSQVNKMGTNSVPLAVPIGATCLAFVFCKTKARMLAYK
jgi:hypothetical protein